MKVRIEKHYVADVNSMEEAEQINVNEMPISEIRLSVDKPPFMMTEAKELMNDLIDLALANYLDDREEEEALNYLLGRISMMIEYDIDPDKDDISQALRFIKLLKEQK